MKKNPLRIPALIRFLSVFILLAAFSGEVIAQPSNSTSMYIKREEICQFHNYMLERIGTRIGEKILAGELSTYKDVNREKKWNTAELRNNLRYCDSIPVPTGECCQCMEIKEVCTEPDPSSARLVGRYTSRAKDPSLQLTHPADSSLKIFVSEYEAMAVFSPNERLVCDRILNRWQVSLDLSDSMAIYAFTDTVIKQLTVQIYRSALAGDLIVFKNDSMKTPLTIREVRNIEGNCEWVRMSKKPRSKKLMDSLVCPEFDPTRLGGIRVTDEWSRQGDQICNNIWSVSPMFHFYHERTMSGTYPRFSVRWQDVQRIYSKADLAYLRMIIYYTRMHRLDHYFYLSIDND